MNPEEDLRLRLTLQYDGSGYHGWQSQPDVPTVQDEVERIVSRLTGAHRPVLASGRTDRGVHALGQVVSLLVPATWSAPRFARALNALLPRSIWVADCRRVPLKFHPRYDAEARSYLFRLGTHRTARSPFVLPYCWATEGELDTTLLDWSAQRLVGERSFRSFQRTGQPERGDRCAVAAASWRPWSHGFEFRITANRFLHHMVRYLVGTMVALARGRRSREEFLSLLDGAPGVVTSPPAAPAGLFLAHVRYPGDPEWDGHIVAPPFTSTLGVT